MQNKQIVLTSDRPPKEIEVLEERLRNRFEGGLLADVQPPTLETRIAILRRKSEEQKNPVDIKVLEYIAEMDSGDIRTSIGKLTKVIFFSTVPITSLVNNPFSSLPNSNLLKYSFITMFTYAPLYKTFSIASDANFLIFIF